MWIALAWQSKVGSRTCNLEWKANEVGETYLFEKVKSSYRMHILVMVWKQIYEKSTWL